MDSFLFMPRDWNIRFVDTHYNRLLAPLSFPKVNGSVFNVWIELRHILWFNQVQKLKIQLGNWCQGFLHIAKKNILSI